LTIQDEEVAHKELVDGSETVLHSHPGGGGGGPTESGIVITDAEGMAVINFVGAYATKPAVSLTVEYLSDAVMVRIYEWINVFGFVAFTVRTEDDGGKVEGGVTVHWMIWA